MSEDAIFRAQHVGASEVSALFDANPWVTHFELWHRKAGTVDTPDFALDERMKWGVRLEPVIIAAACEEYGYTRDDGAGRFNNGAGLGGHVDCLVTCPTRGPGVVEVKTADWLVAKQWGDEPPLHYLLQGNTYAGLTGRAWFDLVALVGGNDLRRWQYEFRPALYAEAERRTAAFWDSVRAAKAPKPDFTSDLETIKALNATGTEGASVDLSADNLAADAAARLLRAQEARKAAEAEVAEAEAELRHKIGEASFATLAGFTARLTTVAGVPDRIVTADEVGSTIKGRRGYRKLTVKEAA